MSPLSPGIRKRLIAYGSLLILMALLAGVGYWVMFSDPGGYRDTVLESTTSTPIEELSSNIKTSVHHLASTIGERNLGEEPENLEAARRWIRSRLEEWKYDVEEETYEETANSFSNDPQTGRLRRDKQTHEVAHLVAERPGTTHPESILLFGAHYDSVEGSPGANDNATGVAVLLELARLFRDQSFDRTVRFVFFVNEEPPYFHTPRMGSRIYAKRCHERGDSIHAMFSLETIGYYSEEPGSQKYPPIFNWIYPDRGNFLGVVGNLGSRWLVRKTTRLLREAIRFPIQSCSTWGKITGIFWSDHASFWPYGWPAVMLSDSAFFRDPHYHQAGDTPERLNYPALGRITFGLTHVLKELATHTSR